jgi:hypothetical protein
MASTLLLDATTWSLTLDTAGNIAVAGEPYALAQDAASAIKTFIGECYWDTKIGIPYLTRIFGRKSSLNYIKAQMVVAAMTVPNVASAQCFVQAISDRSITIQVQVVSKTTGRVTAATFTVINPQGIG